MKKIIGLTFFILIIGTAIIFKTGWRPSWNTTTTTTTSKSWNFSRLLYGAGGIVLVAFAFFFLLKHHQRETSKPTPGNTTIQQQQQPLLAFPTSGEGWATKQVGVKAWLDPKHTFTRASGKYARYVLAENPNLFFDDTDVVATTNKNWQQFPAGNYIVFPLGTDKIHFHWWQ